jgi:hypothetical protein
MLGDSRTGEGRNVRKKGCVGALRHLQPFSRFFTSKEVSKGQSIRIEDS